MYGVRTVANTSGLEICGYIDCALDYLMPTLEQVSAFIDRLEKPEEYPELLNNHVLAQKAIVVWIFLSVYIYSLGIKKHFLFKNI